MFKALDGIERIVLASKSPRRFELLSLLGVDILCVDSKCNEETDIISPRELVMELSKRKAESVSPTYKEDIVIGSDTVVCIDGRILGKPQSPEEAFSMLKLLSGREHVVYTGVSIVKGDSKITFFEETSVVMNDNDDELLEKYVASGEPMDKAGAYGIQGPGALLIKGINGDYYNVMGLPISKVYKNLKKVLDL